VINTLKLRYYFSDESFTQESSVMFDYAAWNGPGPPYNLPFKEMCSATLMLLPPTNPAASSYIEFGCDSAATITSTDKVTIQLRSATQGEDVTNDYSYVAGDGASSTLDNHLVIYQGAALVWGQPP
jgi:hypothetical protein